MFGSIFIGLSGMNAYSAGLRQISNNITNINSLGFKSSDLSFVNLFGTGTAIGNGGGQGVTLSAPRLDFAQGELRQTDRALDLAIEGDGFLVLLKDAQTFFARTGSFEVSEDGFIVLAGTDYKLTVLDASGNATPISLDAHRTNAPQATTTIRFADNLSSTAPAPYDLSNITVYDAQGEADTWRVHFERAAGAPAGEWAVSVTNGAGTAIGSGTLRFINGVVDPTTAQLTIQDTAEGRSATLDFGQTSSFSSGAVSTLRVASADGFGAGEIVSSGVNAEGMFEITYSNGQKTTLGAITLASFRNPQFLEQRGGGLFSYSGSLPPEFATSARQDLGRVVSGRLETSNVDLAQEFGDLILVQRGFQASSQVVSVSNDMIQQLFGIRGQG